MSKLHHGNQVNYMNLTCRYLGIVYQLPFLHYHNQAAGIHPAPYFFDNSWIMFSSIIFLFYFFKHNLNQKFSLAISALSHLDCLISLYRAKDAMGAPMCRPSFVCTDDLDEKQRAVLELGEMRHPCLVNTGRISNFIPNDTNIGGTSASTLILTGPNMGGKSTLLRQTCIAVIMAQLGCWVPGNMLYAIIISSLIDYLILKSPITEHGVSINKQDPPPFFFHLLFGILFLIHLLMLQIFAI